MNHSNIKIKFALLQGFVDERNSFFQKFKKALQKKAIKEKKADMGLNMTCFKCLGNHSLRDCNQPQNQMTINENRKNHNANRA